MCIFELIVFHGGLRSGDDTRFITSPTGTLFTVGKKKHFS